MRTVIISLNSKYIHSSLAPWYLKSSCSQYGQDCGEVLVSEHTINENPDSVLSSIYLMKPDIVAISCYIWNISQVLVLASNLKKLLPSLIIVLGGPEVSYDASETLKCKPFIDFIIKGEGEAAFPELVSMIYRARESKTAAAVFCESEAAEVSGLVYRSGDKIVENESAVINDLNSIASPYTDEMITSLKNKIVYFESSRGCPFSCSYCLSSVNEGVRNFSLQRVYSDLDKLVSSGAGQIKFVDRTFNVSPGRAKEIVRHIIGLNKRLTGGDRAVCNFHFEVGADLFDDEFIELLNSAPKGLFQLEAGVQSTNPEALAEVCRKTDLNKLFLNISKIKKSGNVHIHADLIAGLPLEDYSSFGKSFSRVYSAKPHQLQLGFLKLLKGTRLRAQAKEHGCIFRETAPYEILAGNCISYDELIRLKGIAELVERYYNSVRFSLSLDFLIERYFSSPFSFYESFYQFHIDNGYMDMQAALRDQYRILNDFHNITAASEEDLFFRELLRLDFLLSDSSGTLPYFMERRGSSELKEKYFEFLHNTELINRIIPETAGMTPKQILKNVHFEPMYLEFSGARQEDEMSFRLFRPVNNSSVYVFNYFSRDIVTGRYSFHSLKI